MRLIHVQLLQKKCCDGFDEQKVLKRWVEENPEMNIDNVWENKDASNELERGSTDLPDGSEGEVWSPFGYTWDREELMLQKEEFVKKKLMHEIRLLKENRKAIENDIRVLNEEKNECQKAIQHLLSVYGPQNTLMNRENQKEKEKKELEEEIQALHQKNVLYQGDVQHKLLEADPQIQTMKQQVEKLIESNRQVFCRMAGHCFVLVSKRTDTTTGGEKETNGEEDRV